MREKLIELLRQGLHCPPSANMGCSDCRLYGIVGCWLQKAADHLIAHGVTIQTEEINFDYEAEVE